MLYTEDLILLCTIMSGFRKSVHIYTLIFYLTYICTFIGRPLVSIGNNSDPIMVTMEMNIYIPIATFSLAGRIVCKRKTKDNQ